MVRFLKWFFPISMAVLIVVAASAYWYATPQRLKTIVQPHLSSALGREVMFDRIEWGLSDGVVFSELRVEGRAAGGGVQVPFWLRSGHRCICLGGSCCRFWARWCWKMRCLEWVSRAMPKVRQFYP